uniref:Uncharacterized protein n=1 Tax=Chromera velia CCMP2878 TaxID=1169474 RepID=A0A0G4ID53_9ALVE|eukprot:Cvel_2304.t1-p1 / transcript=Cvel_2304.t1 / gene=Cvel_2304 / organism=Chromera_velia_CCMP2878 / gene_product=hypothetical protein / transcript_product=hypothetical protein / location=Cvel_scaffold89:41439-48133(+) / protein_length=365 / sequence_SO=supercontig / SO=protein_coding / is_pseudo=false
MNFFTLMEQRDYKGWLSPHLKKSLDLKISTGHAFRWIPAEASVRAFSRFQKDWPGRIPDYAVDEICALLQGSHRTLLQDQYPSAIASSPPIPFVSTATAQQHNSSPAATSSHSAGPRKKTQSDVESPKVSGAGEEMSEMGEQGKPQSANERGCSRREGDALAASASAASASASAVAAGAGLPQGPRLRARPQAKQNKGGPSLTVLGNARFKDREHHLGPMREAVNELLVECGAKLRRGLEFKSAFGEVMKGALTHAAQAGKEAIVLKTEGGCLEIAGEDSREGCFIGSGEPIPSEVLETVRVEGKVLPLVEWERDTGRRGMMVFEWPGRGKVLVKRLNHLYKEQGSRKKRWFSRVAVQSSFFLRA